MATNQPGGNENLDTVLRLIFEEQGTAKVEAALKRVQAQQKQFFDGAKTGAKETEAAVSRVDSALSRLGRAAQLDKIERAFIAATKKSKDYVGELKAVEDQLKRVGATQSEVDAIAARGAGVSGANRGAALQAFGREARLSVPAFPIPGTGLSTEFLFRVSEVAGRLNLSFKDLAIAGAAAGVAIVGISLALKQFEAVVGPIARTLQTIQKARVDTAGVLATGNAQEVVDTRQKALDDLIRLEGQLAKAEADLANQQANLFRPGLNILEQMVGALGEIGVGPIGDAKKQVSDLQAQFAAASDTLSTLNPVYQEYLDKLETERIQRLQESNLDTLRGIEAGVLQGGVDALNQEIEARERQNALIERDLNTYLLSAEKQEELRNQMDFNITVIDHLNGKLREQVEETERLAKAEEYLNDQRKEIAALTEKVQDDLARVEEQAAERRLELAQRFNDRLVDIAQKAADAAEDAVRKLEQKRADLSSDLGNDLADAETEHAQEQLDARLELLREDAKAAREHADRIRDIERRSRASSRQAIQDRDAIALQAAEDQLTEDIQSENDRFAAGKRERDIAYREELADQQTQFAREREQRYAKYQRDLAEAQLQFDREAEQQAINQARQIRDLTAAHEQELALFNSKTSQQLTLIRSAYSQELAIVSTAQSARLKLEAQHQARLLAQAARFMNLGTFTAPQQFGGNGGYTRTMAGGGYLGGGESALVNEIRRESFTDKRGRTIPLPEGMGVFTPTQGGRVNPNGEGSAATLNLNVSGATVRTVQSASRAQAMQVISEVLDDLGVA